MGKIIDANVSFQDQNGNFYHGVFVIVSTEHHKTVRESECSDIPSTLLSTEKGKPFATPGDNGAAVVDKQSGIILGFPVAILDNYITPFKNVTFCLRLNYALYFLCDTYNLRIGTFRTFEI